MAGIVALTIDQGADLDRLLTWTDSDGTPIDLTGWAARMEIRSKPGGSLYAAFDTDDGSIVLGDAAGTIRITASAATTSAWTWARGVYDLELTDGAGKVTRLIQGSVTLTPEVTQ